MTAKGQYMTRAQLLLENVRFFLRQVCGEVRQPSFVSVVCLSCHANKFIERE